MRYIMIVMVGLALGLTLALIVLAFIAPAETHIDLTPSTGGNR